LAQVRYIETTAASGARTLAWAPLDPLLSQTPFNVQIAVNKTGNGVFTGTVQYTLENLLEAGVSAYAISERVSVAAVTAFNMTHPAYGVRFVVASASGHNNITFRVLQTGA
jgi:hypothetical protein